MTMTLKVKYYLLIGLVHLLIIALSWPLFKDYKVWFILAELAVLISIFMAFKMGQQFIAPLQLIADGTRAIQDRDFQVKFKATGQKEMDQLVHVYNKMIDTLREERTLKEEQYYLLRKIIQASPTGIILLDFDQAIADFNPAALQLLQAERESILKRKLSETGHKLLEQAAHINEGESVTVELDGIKKFKCQRASFINQGFEQSFLLVEDVSHELIKTEKQAFSKVIRMMSHEINNSMGAVNSLLDTLTHYAPADEEDRTDYLQALEVITKRNQSLNRFMNNFADVVRLPDPHFEMADLKEVVAGVFTLMKPRCQGMGVSLELQVPEAPYWLNIDVEQIEQVLINAVKNAAEAIITEKESGVVKLILSDTEKRLVVQDNGPGIPEEIARKMFSPFFSTKKDGQGIGLTLCREILLNHLFDFQLLTKETGLTEFEILLNRHKKAT